MQRRGGETFKWSVRKELDGANRHGKGKGGTDRDCAADLGCKVEVADDDSQTQQTQYARLRALGYLCGSTIVCEYLCVHQEGGDMTYFSCKIETIQRSRILRLIREDLRGGSRGG